MKKSEGNNHDSLKKRNDRAFDMQFVGEGGIDAGGLFREALSDLSKEVQSTFLPLLIPSPNQKNNHGENREKFVVNPSSDSKRHEDMFKFFGMLVGYSFVNKENNMELDLPSMFWKQLRGDKVGLDDLKRIDNYIIQCFDQVKNIGDACSEEEYNEYIEQYYIVSLSNGKERDIVPDGANKRVG